MRPAFLLLACSACTGSIDMKVPPVEPSPPTRVDGALVAGTTATRSELGMTEPGQQLATLGGALAVAGTETLYRFDAETTTFSPVPVGDVGETMALGPVRHLARRGAGLFVVAEGGLFHDASGRLLRSPLSMNVAAADVRALDDLGEGDAEELWLTTTSGVERVRGGVMTRIAVDHGGPVDAELAAAVEPGKGVVLARGNLYSVDVAAKTATWEAKDLPPVSAVARGDDGTLFFATSQGLFARAKTGAVTHYTLGGAAVADVTTAFGDTLLVAGGQVAQLTAAGATSFGAVTSPREKGLARDSNGDTFVLDGTSLIKLATGRVVSFDADVKPFMVAHCTGCHTTGASYSPVFDLASFAVVSEPAFLQKIVQRLTANGKPPMPPPDVEVLTSSDYAVVLRWVAGGKQP